MSGELLLIGRASAQGHRFNVNSPITATLLDHLSELILGLEHWGYVIVFLIVVLECQAFLGLHAGAKAS